MNAMFHVVGFAGSLRVNSLNKKILRAAGELMPDGMELEILDLAPLPFYNQDIESKGLPEPVAFFRGRVAAADGLLIATPEYNATVPAVLKNALEWLSRPLPDLPLDGKPAAIMGVGGRLGTSRAQAHLRQIGVSANLLILSKPEILVTHAADKFDAQGNLVDDVTRKVVLQQMEALVQWIRLLRGEAVRT